MSRVIHSFLVVGFVLPETLACRLCPDFGPPPGFTQPNFRSNKIDIYYTPGSPPSGMILMALKIMDIDANLKRVDLANQEQLRPEYLEINPQHTVPAMDDEGFTLGESRAILAYLAELTHKGRYIYPKCPWKRAKIDEMLYFDVGRLYATFQTVYNFSPQNPTDEQRKKLDESFGMFEEYLSRNGWAAYEQMSIADVSLLSTVGLAEFIGYNLSNYPRVMDWLSKMKAAVPDYESTIKPNLDAWKAIYDASRQN